MSSGKQSCNTCDAVDYAGELDDAGRCAECVAFVAHQERKHDGIHAKAPCERGWRASGEIIFDAYVSREDDAVTKQSCNACDVVDYVGELDDAGRCSECVAQEREFVAHHAGGLDYLDDDAANVVAQEREFVAHALWCRALELLADDGAN